MDRPYHGQDSEYAQRELKSRFDVPDNIRILTQEVDLSRVDPLGRPHADCGHGRSQGNSGRLGSLTSVPRSFTFNSRICKGRNVVVLHTNYSQTKKLDTFIGSFHVHYTYLACTEVEK